MNIPDYVLRNFRGIPDPAIPGLPVYAWYFNERESIRIRREDRNLPQPWTDDHIMHSFRFTNIHREDDRVSRQLYQSMDLNSPPGTILFNSFVFRTFNCQSGYDATGGYHYLWHPGQALSSLNSAYDRKVQLFSAAYMMVNTMATGMLKHEFYVKVFDSVWDQRVRFIQEMVRNPTLEQTTKMFTCVPGYAEFLGYELALDMEMLDLLKPTDVFTWANPGPGARRGLNFVFGRPKDFRQPTAKFLEEMQYLFKILPPLLHCHVEPSLITMRCIENGLCETSKYARVLEIGHAKRRYRPLASQANPG